MGVGVEFGFGPGLGFGVRVRVTSGEEARHAHHALRRVLRQ